MKKSRRSSFSESTPDMICLDCGRSIAPSIRVCPNCGKKLSGTPQPQPKPAPILSPVLRRTHVNDPIVDNGENWSCGRERLLQAAAVVFGDDPAPFLTLPPGDDNRIAAICALARFVADDPENSFKKSLGFYDESENHFVIKKYAVGFGHVYTQKSYDGGCYDECDIDKYITVQKCSAAEYIAARRQIPEDILLGCLPFSSSEHFDVPNKNVYRGAQKGVHYYKNWRGLKGCYKVDETEFEQKPETPDSVDEYSDWLCGKDRLIELSHVVFPENADDPRELCALLELMDSSAWLLQWVNGKGEFINNKKYEFSPHSVTSEWTEDDWTEVFYDGGKNRIMETWKVECRRVFCKIGRSEYEQAKAISVKGIGTVTFGNGECLEMPVTRRETARFYYKDYKGLKGYYKLYETRNCLR